MGLSRSAAASVERVCERELEERTLRIELVRAFRAAVPFEDYAWLLTDPETTVGSAPLADVRCLPELPRLIGLRYRTTVNRWTDLDGAASLAEATGGDLAQSLVWRELLRRHDVGDVRDGRLPRRVRPLGLGRPLALAWRASVHPGRDPVPRRVCGAGHPGIAPGSAAVLRRPLVGRRAAGRRRARADRRSRRAGPDAPDDGVPAPPGASGRRPVAGPGRRVQRRRPAARRRGGRRRPPAVVPRPPPRRPMGHAARRPDRRGEDRWSGHRGHHRADRSRRPARGLRPCGRALAARVRAGRAGRGGPGQHRDRGPDVPLAAHGPGPPQVGLREDRRRTADATWWRSSAAAERRAASASFSGRPASRPATARPAVR